MQSAIEARTGNQAGIAVDNARLLAEIEERNTGLGASPEELDLRAVERDVRPPRRDQA